jgi:hypothetical protein
MDKNMISIDDLVRQRLGGGEENERAGAWLQMRDLLDKEMPQVRPAAIFWRRTLSAVALLLLLATAGIGSYKIFNGTPGDGASASVAGNETVPNTKTKVLKENNTTGNHLILASSKSIAGNTVNLASAPTIRNIAGNTPGNESGNESRGDDRTDGDDKATVGILSSSATGEENPAIAHKKTNKQSRHTNTKSSSTAANNTSGEVNNSSTDTKVAAAPATSVNEKTADEKKMADSDDKLARSKTTGESEAAMPVSTSDDNNAATATSTPSKNEKKISKAPKHHTSASIAKTTTTKTAAPASGTAQSADNDALADNAGIPEVTSGSTMNKSSATSGAAKEKSESKKQVAVKSTRKKIHSRTADIKTMALAGHVNTTTTMTKTIARPNNLAGNTTPGKLLAKKTKGHAGKANPAVASAAVSKRSATNSGDKKQDLSGSLPTAKSIANIDITTTAAANKAADKSKPDANAEALKKLSVANMSKRKKVIQKMELYQHLIKNTEDAPADRIYHLDTLSIQTLTEDIDDDNAPGAARSSRKKQLATVLNASADPADAPPVADKVAEEAKLKAKQKSGVTLVENLQAKFNDIKYNVASVQFSPGLTAGINGTFFGPNSFKGFQFGLTGEFVFDDKWSMMVELKYFHRVNNDYTMNDNYNTYNYNQSKRAYEKDSFAHSYSFSTLHSFELPVTVRYTKKNYTFYAGGNVAYTLGVNPSENPQIYPIPPSYVTTPGSNGTPRFTPGDLQATRVGVGYMFGFAYKIASNMVLDVRNVQTIWDNASGSGSRIISTQLYKSPSLQLSFNYRFGGNKEKE